MFVACQVDSMKVSELLSGTKLTEDAFYKFLQALIDSKMLVTSAAVRNSSQLNVFIVS